MTPQRLNVLEKLCLGQTPPRIPLADSAMAQIFELARVGLSMTKPHEVSDEAADYFCKMMDWTPQAMQSGVLIDGKYQESELVRDIAKRHIRAARIADGRSA